MAASDDIIEHAAEFLRRISPEGRAASRRRRERRKAAARRLARRLLLATVAILAVAVAAGIVRPIGVGGVFAMLLAMLVAWTAVILWSQAPAAEPERFAATDLAQLPARTGEWLDRQRAALPAPAQRGVDRLAAGLDTLGAQLAALDPRSAEAVEVRRLIGDELPELVRGYQRVPPALRRTPQDGRPSPDRQLADGLATIGGEVERLNRRLADGDLKALATQNRYLEIKYRGEDDGVGR